MKFWEGSESSEEGGSGISLGISSIAIVILILAFYGEPDLITALIQYLMEANK